jgi:hypothetical protein
MKRSGSDATKPTTDMPWSRPFEDPVTLPDGRALRTLQDAADYMMALSAADQRSEQWRLAGEVVIMADEDRGPLMHARVGMLRAINHGRPDEPAGPRRKRAKQYTIIESQK